MAEHPCNAYCGAEGHCDIVYTGLRESLSGALIPHHLDPERWRAEITASYAQRGLRVTRVLPAREAPPLDPQRADALVAGPHGPADQARWLVWWHPSDAPQKRATAR